jgi:branched-chain amino acid transport system permease protein
MTILEGTLRGVGSRWRDYQRWAREALVGPGLWLLIALSFIVFAVNPDTRQLVVAGVVVGSILALGALGLTLIYGVLKFGNFAHGDLMVLGGYIAFFLLTGRMIREANDDAEVLPVSLDSLPGSLDRISELSFGYGLLLALVVSSFLMGLLFLALDRIVYRPLRRRKAGIVIVAVASLGVALIVRSAVLIFWGPDPRRYVGGISRAKSLLFDVRLQPDQIFILAVALGLTVAVFLLLYRSKLGKAMRAMSDNADLAKVSGINTDRVVMWTWLIGGGLAGVAGVLLALQSQLNPQLGFVTLLPLFAAAILGGVGNPLGALIGGLVVGIAQAVSTEYFAPGYQPGVAFLILIAILLVRPSGLFGAKV